MNGSNSSCPDRNHGDNSLLVSCSPCLRFRLLANSNSLLSLPHQRWQHKPEVKIQFYAAFCILEDVGFYLYWTLTYWFFLMYFILCIRILHQEDDQMSRWGKRLLVLKNGVLFGPVTWGWAEACYSWSELKFSPLKYDKIKYFCKEVATAGGIHISASLFYIAYLAGCKILKN